MHELLKDLPEVINCVFDVLELLVVRVTLLGLVAFGAHALLRKHGLRRTRGQTHQ